MTKGILLLLGGILLLGGCMVIHDYKKMTYYRRQLDNSKIKMNGYYSHKWNYGENDKKNDIFDTTTYTHYIAFFNDGTYFNAGSYEKESDLKFDSLTIKNLWKLSYTWGCYITEGDTIKVQTFYHIIYFPYIVRWTVATERWYIHNDSTIESKEFNYLGKKETISNTLYHFKQCNDCKPDSTNFIKKSKRMQKIITKREK